MKKQNIISSAILVTGMGFMLYGIIVRQENLVVLNKAIRICMECIGIG